MCLITGIKFMKFNMQVWYILSSFVYHRLNTLICVNISPFVFNMLFNVPNAQYDVTKIMSFYTNEANL